MIHRLSCYISLCLLALTATAEVPGIHLADKTLKVEFIDSDAKEFFISQTMDLVGLRPLPRVPNGLPALSRKHYENPTINPEIGVHPQAACGSTLTFGQKTCREIPSNS
jgi:hypothetical protein